MAGIISEQSAHLTPSTSIFPDCPSLPPYHIQSSPFLQHQKAMAISTNPPIPSSHLLTPPFLTGYPRPFPNKPTNQSLNPSSGVAQFCTAHPIDAKPHRTSPPLNAHTDLLRHNHTSHRTILHRDYQTVITPHFTYLLTYLLHNAPRFPPALKPTYTKVPNQKRIKCNQSTPHLLPHYFVR